MEIDYVHGKWNVRQLLTIGLNTSEDSPYGQFSDYVMNEQILGTL